MTALILALAFLQVEVSGDLWLAGGSTDSELVDGQTALSFAGVPFTLAGEDVDRFTGRGRLRLEFGLSEGLEAVLEIESRSREGGLRIAFDGEDPGVTGQVDVRVEQAYLDIGGRLLIGAQDLRYTLRPHGEAAFLDLTESESAWAGMNLAGTALRNFTFPDTLEPAGVIYRIDERGGWRIDLFAMTMLENGEGSDPGEPTDEDERLFGVYFDAIPDPERLKIFALLALMDGPPTGSSVTTFGLGANLYLGDGKELELFAEFYLQRGGFASGLDKEAEAHRLGGRWVQGKVSFEAWAFRATGDRTPADGDEGSFQSYESMNRLEILMGDEWGFDFDSNIRFVVLTAAVKLDRFRISLDIGTARFDHDPLDFAGAPVTADKDLGTEVDLEIGWELSGSVELYLTAAKLDDSDALKSLIAEDGGTLWVVGGRIEW